MNSRRSFLKALPLVPAALAGAAVVAKAAPKLDLDEIFDLCYKIKQERERSEPVVLKSFRAYRYDDEYGCYTEIHGFNVEQRLMEDRAYHNACRERAKADGSYVPFPPFCYY